MTALKLLIAALLLIEALWTVVKTAELLVTIAAYDPIAIVLIAARAFVGALQLTAAMLLLNRRPQAAPLARAGFLLSAALLVLEAGFQLAPSDAYAFWRWQVVGLYWAYAVVMTLALTSNRLQLNR